jgi:hypothetical protein
VQEEHSEAGIMGVYRNSDQEFVFQFLFEDMSEAVLGPEFYLIIPCKHLAMTLVPNRVNESKVLEGMLKLKEFAVKLHAKESYAISEKLYHIKDGQITKLG